MSNTLKDVFKPNHSYYAHHVPTGEDWVILAVNQESGKCFAAGWPHTVAEISDCVNWKLRAGLTHQEELHVKEYFFKWD